MTELKCWNCGESLDDIPTPISRQANCPACFNELHCCRLCIHYDASIAADQCAEDRADPPVIKDSANFCEWFAPRANAFGEDTNEKRDAALTKLDDLFAIDDPGKKPEAKATEKPQATPPNREDDPRAALDRLFSTTQPLKDGDGDENDT
jgi:hypothetical protein